MTKFALSLWPLFSAPVPAMTAQSLRSVLALSGVVVAGVFLGLFVSPLVGLVPVALMLAGLIIAVFVRYPRVWIYCGAIVHYFWIAQGRGDDDITLKEYALVLFFFGGLAIWFFGMVVIRRKRIIRHFGDKLILSAIALSVFNLPIALMNDASPLTWAREWLLFLMMLYYFPWREHLTERKHIQTFFFCHAAVFVFIGGANVFQYVKAASNVLYAYQIWASRKMLNTHVFLCATLFAALGGFYAVRRNTKILMLGLLGFYALVVVVSFSRGFWISGMVAIILMLWLLDKRKLALFAVYSVIAGFVFVLAVQTVFPDKSAFIFKVLNARLSSSATGTQDLSLRSRFYETQEILNQISQYPLSGFGLGSSFRYYEPIGNSYSNGTFIHNGYLFVWVKLGLPFFLAFYTFWFYMMRRAYRIATSTPVPMAKILAAGCCTCLVAFTILNVTSSIAEGRDGFYCLSICFASLGFAELLTVQQRNSAKQVSEKMLETA
jgi:O-Antigen ligase